MSEITLNPRVLDLVCSRICHDLISPVSAINNGIELISDMEGGMGGDAMGLIADSAQVAAGRLALMRYAFGAATPTLDEVREVAITYFSDSKITLTWPRTGLPEDFTDRQGFPKVLLNFVLVLAESIGASGNVTIESPNPAEIVIQAQPRSGTIRADVLAGIDTTSTDTLDARTIQAFIAGMLTKRFGFSLKRETENNVIVFTLR